jgi:hypothetical protein
MELNKRYVNVWLKFDQASKLEGIAKERKVDVGQVVQDILLPVLGNDENTTGRFVLLRVPESAYRTHLKWFDGDAELAKASMVGSVVCTAEDFADVMRRTDGK